MESEQSQKQVEARGHAPRPSSLDTALRVYSGTGFLGRGNEITQGPGKKGGCHPPLIWNDREQGKNRIYFFRVPCGIPFLLNRIGFVVLDFRGALNGSGRLRR